MSKRYAVGRIDMSDTTHWFDTLEEVHAYQDTLPAEDLANGEYFLDDMQDEEVLEDTDEHPDRPDPVAVPRVLLGPLLSFAQEAAKKALREEDRPNFAQKVLDDLEQIYGLYDGTREPNR